MRYVVKVGGTFHYRRRVPEDLSNLLGKNWWKQSLKTSNQHAAEVGARALGALHDQEIARLRSLPPPDRTTLLAVQSEAARDRADILKHDERTSAAELGDARKDADALELQVLAAAELQLGKLDLASRKLIDNAGGLRAFIQRTERVTDFLQAQRIALGLNEAAPGVNADYDTEKQRHDWEFESARLAKAHAIVERLGLKATALADDPNNPRITAAMEEWFKERKQGKAALKRHRVAVNRFVELFGDTPVRSITRDMVKKYRETIENLTDHRLLPANERGGLRSYEDLPKVSAPTVNRHLITIKALLRFCAEDKNWIPKNVATGIKPPKDLRPKASKRRSMTREERCQLLARAVAEYGIDSERAWLIKIAAYTGSRLGEVAQLARENVKRVEGIWVIEFDDLDGRHLKTRSSVRTTPLHSAIRDDFLAWMQKTKDKNTTTKTRVFSSFIADEDGRYSTRLSGDMGRLMDRAGLPDPRLVMHSFRHSLKVAMADDGIDGEYRRLIVGHAPRDTHEMDYEKASMAAIAREFEKMKPLF